MYPKQQFGNSDFCVRHSLGMEILLVVAVKFVTKISILADFEYFSRVLNIR